MQNFLDYFRSPLRGQKVFRPMEKQKAKAVFKVSEYNRDSVTGEAYSEPNRGRNYSEKNTGPVDAELIFAQEADPVYFGWPLMFGVQSKQKMYNPNEYNNIHWEEVYVYSPYAKTEGIEPFSTRATKF